MSELRAFIDSLIGRITIVAFCGFGTVSGTGSVVVRNIIVEGVTLCRTNVRYSIGLIASFTLSGLSAVLSAGCVVVRNVILKFVIELGSLIIGVAVATLGAGIGCITACGTSRLGNYVSVAMLKSRNFNILGLSLEGAVGEYSGIGLCACLFARCLAYDLALCVYGFVLVSTASVLTGSGSLTSNDLAIAGDPLVPYIAEAVTGSIVKSYLTYGTDLILGTGCSSTGSMSRLSNSGLTYNGLATGLTSFTIGKTFLFTGCRIALYGLTVLVLTRRTGGMTNRTFGCIALRIVIGMGLNRNYLLGALGIRAVRTLEDLGKTGLCTGSGLAVGNEIMTCERKLLNVSLILKLGILKVCGIGYATLYGTGRSYSNSRRDNSLGNIGIALSSGTVLNCSAALVIIRPIVRGCAIAVRKLVNVFALGLLNEAVLGEGSSISYSSDSNTCCGNGLGCYLTAFSHNVTCVVLTNLGSGTGLIVCTPSVSSIGIVVVELAALGYLTYRAGLGSVTGCVVPLVAKLLALSCGTYGADLGFGTGCILPVVTKCITLSHAAVLSLTGLRICTGCGLPVVVKCLALGCLTCGTGLGCGTGCRCPGVSKHSNNLLLGKDVFTVLTLQTLGKTGFSTGCCLCSKNLGIGMTAICIANEVTALVITGCVVVIIILMSCCRLGILSLEHGIALRALLTLGKSGLGTGGSYGCKSFLFVSCRGNSLLLNGGLTACRALLTLGKSVLGTGSSLAIKLYLSVRNLLDRLGIGGLIASLTRTGEGLNALLGTGRSLGYLLAILVGVFVGLFAENVPTKEGRANGYNTSAHNKRHGKYYCYYPCHFVSPLQKF